MKILLEDDFSPETTAVERLEYEYNHALLIIDYHTAVDWSHGAGNLLLQC